LLAAWWLWRRESAPEPPAVELTGVDPAVAAAVEEARAAVRRSPGSAAAWGRLGMVLTAHDFNEEAQPCFAEAERRDPQEPRWPYHQGLWLALTDPEAAAVKLRRAAELGGENFVAAALRLAELLQAQGLGDEAEGWLVQVLRRAPDDARARLGLGRLACRRGELAPAREHLTAAAADPLTRKAAHTLLAEVYRRGGDGRAADEELTRAEALPDNPPRPDPYVEEVARLKVGEAATFRRANRMVERGQSREALGLLRRAVHDYPASSRCWVLLAWAANEQKDYPEGEAAARAALCLEPDLPAAHLCLGIALVGRGRAKEAAACFRRALEFKPNYTEAHYNLALCLRWQGERAAAVESLRTAVRCRPESVRSHARLGEWLAEDGRYEEAAEALEQAARLDPDDGAVRQRLAEVRQRLGTAPGRNP
jgi:tetratricopeptide (TPR) repeat protein